MTDTYVKIQLVGTPDDCIQQIAELRSLTGLDHLVCEFSYGGLPHDEAEQNLRLFADKVKPVLHSDSLFTQPAKIVTDLPTIQDTGVFVPAYDVPFDRGFAAA